MKGIKNATRLLLPAGLLAIGLGCSLVGSWDNGLGPGLSEPPAAVKEVLQVCRQDRELTAGAAERTYQALRQSYRATPDEGTLLRLACLAGHLQLAPEQRPPVLEMLNGYRGRAAGREEFRLFADLQSFTLRDQIRLERQVAGERQRADGLERKAAEAERKLAEVERKLAELEKIEKIIRQREQPGNGRP